MNEQYKISKSILFMLAMVILSLGFTSSAWGADVIIAPPEESKHIDLKPYDDPAKFYVLWYCGVDLRGQREVAESYFKAIATGVELDVLGKATNKKTSAVKISAAKGLRDGAKGYLAEDYAKPNIFFGFPPQKSFILDPPQGETVSRTKVECYSSAELAAYKREAIRWAHYILDIYLPKHFPRLK